MNSDGAPLDTVCGSPCGMISTSPAVSETVCVSELRHGLSLGDEVIAAQAARSRGRECAPPRERRHAEAPRGGALCVIENRAGHADRRQCFRESIHRLLQSNAGQCAANKYGLPAKFGIRFSRKR